MKELKLILLLKNEKYVVVVELCLWFGVVEIVIVWKFGINVL